jgi:large subunit ribosomal protein L44
MIRPLGPLRRPVSRSLQTGLVFGNSLIINPSRSYTKSHPSTLFEVPKPNAFDFGKHARKGDKEPISESVAAKSPRLRALHARLNLDANFPFATLARSLICPTADVKYSDNLGMASFGKNLLSFYVYEHFMKEYPRLPPTVLKHVVLLYTGVQGLSSVAKIWGIETDTSSAFTRYMADKNDEQIIGNLVYRDFKENKEPGVVQISDNGTDFNAAASHFVRALVAGIYAHGGMEEAKSFIHNYIIKPRKLDIASVMSFEQPTRELVVLCNRQNLEKPISRLMAESGRYSSTPVFVVGVFSGTKKLGEGTGASLKEARIRAAVNALKSWYLYSPVNDNAQPYVDSGVVVI